MRHSCRSPRLNRRFAPSRGRPTRSTRTSTPRQRTVGAAGARGVPEVNGVRCECPPGHLHRAGGQVTQHRGAQRPTAPAGARVAVRGPRSNQSPADAPTPTACTTCSALDSAAIATNAAASSGSASGGTDRVTSTVTSRSPALTAQPSPPSLADGSAAHQPLSRPRPVPPSGPDPRLTTVSAGVGRRAAARSPAGVKLASRQSPVLDPPYAAPVRRHPRPRPTVLNAIVGRL